MQTDRASVQLVPNLSEDKLLQFFSDGLKLAVSKEELSNPRPEFIITLYEAFLKDFGFNVDNLCQPFWPAAEHLESPENYEDILAFANVCGLMKCIAERSGIPNFSLKDILALKRKRARRILSNLANFWKFSCCQLQKWLQIKLEFTSVAEEKRLLKEEVEAKRKVLEEVKLFVDEISSLRTEMVEKYNECVSIIENKTQEKEEVTNAYYAIKQKWADAKRDLNNINVEISSLHERKKELEGKIVSHDQKKEVAELEQKSQLYHLKKEEVSCRIDEYSNMKGLHLKINNELDAALELLDNMSKTTARNREVLSEIELLHAAAKADEEEVNNLIKQHEQKNLESKALEELMQKEEMEHTKRTDEIKKLITQQESQLKELQKKQGTLELEVEKENVLKKIKYHAAIREKFEQSLISKYLSVTEKVQNFNRSEQEKLQKMEDLLVIPNKVSKE